MNHDSNSNFRVGAVAVALAIVASMALVAVWPTETAQAQGKGPPRAPVEPLGLVGVPDVNLIGMLDKTGLNSASWPKITNAGQQIALQRLGKALFWDMQVGGDGIQGCASCHYNAGTDNRITNQINPGLKHDGGRAPDLVADLTGVNTTLTLSHYQGVANGVANSGFAVSATNLVAAGARADGLQGQPGTHTKVAGDINDVVSSQGVRRGTHQGVSTNRVDSATLAAPDPGFDVTFTNPAPGIPNTARRVEPRNSPSTLNAVYNLRNFHDGRADMFFNGVNPLGFRDPDARVKTYSGTLGEERLNIPLSSLASQAVGPIVNDFETVFSVRPAQDLGKKLTLVGVMPLKGQLVAANDSLLGPVGALPTLIAAGGRGLNSSYPDMIRAIFDSRFTGGAGDVCLDVNGAFVLTTGPGGCTSAYTLMQWNFTLFFGLAVQAYEATLFTEETIVDLLAGGIAYGTVTNGKNVVTVGTNVGTATNPRVLNGLALEGCIALAQASSSVAQVAAATDVCAAHYAKFIHPWARTGSESATARFPVIADSQIGNDGGLQCGAVGSNTVFPLTAAQASGRCLAARNTLRNVDRGLGRFFAGATACGVCHINPEFTGATVSTITGLGAQLPVLPPGQLRKELEARALMERMVAFNGAVTVYDAGFYNVGVRPTLQDLSIGDQIDGVPLSMSKLFDALGGGRDTSNNNSDPFLNFTKIAGPIAASIAKPITVMDSLRLPTTISVLGGAANNLAPVPFPWKVGCAPTPGLVNANQCVPTVIPGERLLRNGAFKTPSLRNAMFTGPYMHNGSKMNLRQVFNFYKTAGHFTTLNFNNLDAGLRTIAVIDLLPQDEASLIEMMEIGLTDWRVAHQQGKFDHPEICIPNGHDPSTGKTKLVGIPAVGAGGTTERIATFEEMLRGTAGNRANNLQAACTITDLVPIAELNRDSTIDVPPR